MRCYLSMPTVGSSSVRGRVPIHAIRLTLSPPPALPTAPPARSERACAILAADATSIGTAHRPMGAVRTVRITLPRPGPHSAAARMIARARACRGFARKLPRPIEVRFPRKHMGWSGAEFAPRGGEARDGVPVGDRGGIHRSDCGPSIDGREEGPREGVRCRDLGEPGAVVPGSLTIGRCIACSRSCIAGSSLPSA